MASLHERWNQAVAEGKKILGNNAKIPTGKMAVALKGELDADKVASEYMAAREAFSKRILAAENAWSKVKNALTQADHEVADSDYGLDSKKPDEKKKIDQADAHFDKFFDSMEKRVDEYLKQLDDVDRHMEHLSKYKITKA